jgi:AcrR family transcriptional regulator
MSTTTSAASTSNGGRPDRRAQLLRAASRLFFARGFHEVSVADIARDLGLSAGAVYRYVPDKMSMLVDSIEGMVEEWSAAAFAAVAEPAPPEVMLERLARSTTACAVDRAEVVGLWHREAGVLPAEATSRLVATRAHTISAWSDVLRACEPELAEDEVELRVRIALGVLNSVSELRSAGRGRQIDLLSYALQRALRAPVRSGAIKPVLGENGAPLHRSDVIAREAAALFRRRGYGSVGMNDIGAASGVAGPSIYKHYSGKLELLTAVVLPVAVAIEEILAGTSDPGEPAAQRLARFLECRSELAVARKDQVSVFVTESKHLDPKDRRAVSQVHLQERAHLARLIGEARDAPEADAKVVAAACLAMVDSVARSQRHAGDAQAHRLTLAMATGVVSV